MATSSGSSAYKVGIMKILIFQYRGFAMKLLYLVFLYAASEPVAD